MEELLIRGWGLIFRGWRWLQQLPPISDQPVGLSFHTVRRGIDPGDHRYRRGFAEL